MIRFTFTGKILSLHWNDEHRMKKVEDRILGIPFLKDKEQGKMELRMDRRARREWSQKLRKKGISERFGFLMRCYL